MKQKLLDAAAVRKETITVEGEQVIVREVSTMAFAKYGELAATDRLKATASLIANSVVDESCEPVFTEEEAMTLAKVARVATPLVSAVMRLSGFNDKEVGTEKHSVAG